MVVERYYWIIRTHLMGLGSCGKKSCIFKPLQVDNPMGIHLGDNVFVGHYSWLIGASSQKDKGLQIGKKTVIGHFSHIVATRQVVIEDSVLMADKIFITDCTHNYQEVNKPVLEQKVSYLKAVRIGEGSWIGENVSICGASIGKHCVIGANSVIVEDIPDYCVAVGTPARIIKYYDRNQKVWRKAKARRICND